MDERKRVSLCSVGVLNRWARPLFGRCNCSSLSISGDELLSFSSASSSDSRMIVHPGGKIEWCIFKSIALKDKPANTGDTVIFWPLGKCMIVGAMSRIDRLVLLHSSMYLFEPKEEIKRALPDSILIRDLTLKTGKQPALGKGQMDGLQGGAYISTLFHFKDRRGA